jgi:hypothetical protein
MTSAGFQKQVNVVQAPGIPGDYASTNPPFSVDIGPGGFVAGPLGLTVGRFAWASDEYVDGDGAGAVANNFGSGPVTGFVHRDQQGLIVVYLQEASLMLPAGFQATLMSGTDFWIKNSGTTVARPGMYAYANFADGTVSFAAANSANGATSTSFTIAAETNGFNGYANGNVLTVTDSVTGTIYPGTILTGTNVPTGLQIVDQLSGTTGGVGTYSLNYGDVTLPAATAFSGSYGLLTAGGTITGAFGVGDTLSGTGVTSGTQITALGTATGGAGTYIVSPSQTASSGTITSATNVQTKWVCQSTGLAGETVKISSQPLG